MPEIESSFRELENRGEVFASVIRIIPATVIALSGWSALQAGHAGHPLFIVGALYMIVSLVGILLASLRFFKPWLPYTYVGLDVAAIALALTMLAKMHDLEMAHEFSLPIYTLIYVVLVHSALRYRPGIIIFGFVGFLLLLILFTLSLSLGSITGGHLLALANFDDVFHDIGYTSILFLALTAMLLFLIVRRTRELATLVLRNGQLARFFSPDVVRKLLSDRNEQHKLQTRQKVAVVFIDIRGFSSFSEQHPPEKIAQVLENFRTIVCDIVFRNGGTIDKFIGDAVLAVFGTPSSKIDDANRAVQTILEINQEINGRQRTEISDPLRDISVGIGGHFGEVFVGILESGKIIEHTIIGSTVNVAQRLERQTRILETDFLISDELKIAANLPKSEETKLQEVTVKLSGISGSRSLWQPVNS